MRSRRFLVTISVVLAVFGVSACRYLTPGFATTRTTDIVYGDAINENGVLEQLKLDLYTPANDTATDRPVFIWAHGGAFKTGDKEDGADYGREFASRGYVVASINYRMDEDAPPVKVPLDDTELARILWAVADMKAAVRWFRANAASVDADPNRIAVGGLSAGAVMALTTAVTPDQPGDTGDHVGYSSAVCTAVSVAGATDPNIVDIDSGDAGAIFFHGDQDTVVPFSLAEATRDAMVASGLPVEFNVFEGEGHLIATPHRDEILAKTYAWLFHQLVNAADPCL